MTEPGAYPWTDIEVESLRTELSFANERADLERNRADEAERKVVAYAKNAYVHIQRADKAEAEVARLRDQLATIVDLADDLVEARYLGARERLQSALAALAAPPEVRP